MAVVNNTSIKLDVHAPKKDAVVAAPGTAAGPDEFRLWAAAGVEEARTQSIIGDFWKLFRWAKSNMPALAASVATPRVVHMPAGGSDGDIELDGTPTADEVRLEIGANVAGPQKSHFLNRTFRRILERWLEESAGTAAAAAQGGQSGAQGSPVITEGLPNVFTFTGGWPQGTQITVSATVTDPQGDIDDIVVVVQIPLIGGPYTGVDAAAFVATAVDAEAHLQATVSNNVVTIAPADPDYTLGSSMVIG